MRITVDLPNGNTVNFEGDLSAEQIRQVLTSSGTANLAGAPVTERIEGDTRRVSFSQPTGTTKG